MARAADHDIDPMFLSRWAPSSGSGRAGEIPSGRDPVAAFASEGRFA